METPTVPQTEAKTDAVALPSAKEVFEKLGGVSLMEYLARETAIVMPDTLPVGYSTRVGSCLDCDTK